MLGIRQYNSQIFQSLWVICIAFRSQYCFWICTSDEIENQFKKTIADSALQESETYM